MGSVDWLAVILAANLALAVSIPWYGPLFGGSHLLKDDFEKCVSPPRNWIIEFLLLLLSATMMGHNFARMTPGKPWLYFMMSGGLAVAFVIPALLISYSHRHITPKMAAVDAGYWLVAYLTMGTVFWALS